MPTIAERESGLGIGDQPTRHSWVYRAAPWAGWCVFLVPLAIMVHELGHYSAALWLGFPSPVLHYSSISYGDVTGRPASQNGIVGLAGPAVTIVLAVFACGWILFRGPARWAFALAATSASRFVVGVPYTVVNIAITLVGGDLRPPAFDEHKAGTALGWSGDALLASTVIVLVGVLLCIGFRLPRGERSVAWPGLLFGTALGWVVWMKLLGPVLVP